jgi:hypothetical protein
MPTPSSGRLSTQACNAAALEENQVHQQGDSTGIYGETHFNALYLSFSWAFSGGSHSNDDSAMPARMERF